MNVNQWMPPGVIRSAHAYGNGSSWRTAGLTSSWSNLLGHAFFVLLKFSMTFQASLP